MTSVESSVSVTFSGGDPYVEVAMWPDEETAFEVAEVSGGPALIMRVGRVKIRLHPDIPCAVDWCDIAAASRLMAAVSAYIRELDRLYAEQADQTDQDV
ncbi:hypothetical protein GCM10023191_005580 [Actinoallomurus oryzae]|uniref:Uncharacterized protein n=1 Tax=Actinoallomurus oryzae TaxID=502180 RepID=A0ABP8PBQ3_9ACTN